jgi:chemotaxis protein methyltransferase CheR
VESRLMPVARRHGLATLDELLRNVRENSADDVLVEITEAMTTNDSSFFRDITPFETLYKAVLPKMIEARRADGGRSIRIWSTACSSGQEPYSVALMVREHAELFADFDVEIVATDFSRDMVNRAEAGIYSQFEIQRGLPIRMLVNYFSQSDDHWQIDSSIREMVQFRQFNLLDEFAALGKFDIILCRNVLIYFDQATKSDVLRRISMIVPNDGVVYLGASESVLGISKDFKPLPGLRGVYGLVESDYGAPLQQAAG